MWDGLIQKGVREEVVHEFYGPQNEGEDRGEEVDILKNFHIFAFKERKKNYKKKLMTFLCYWMHYLPHVRPFGWLVVWSIIFPNRAGSYTSMLLSALLEQTFD